MLNFNFKIKLKENISPLNKKTYQNINFPSFHHYIGIPCIIKGGVAAVRNHCEYTIFEILDKDGVVGLNSTAHKILISKAHFEINIVKLSRRDKMFREIAIQA